jgi:hypothetical protein
MSLQSLLQPITTTTTTTLKVIRQTLDDDIVVTTLLLVKIIKTNTRQVQKCQNDPIHNLLQYVP